MSQSIRRQLTKLILEAKDAKGDTFEQLAKTLNVNKVWLVSSILGEHPMPDQCARRLLAALDLPSDHVRPLGRFPEVRGNTQDYAYDPVVYRFRELVNVYGPSLKMLVQEECGDGIMSAIDCRLEFNHRKVGEPPNAETRIQVIIDGKFLPYKTG